MKARAAALVAASVLSGCGGGSAAAASDIVQSCDGTPASAYVVAGGSTERGTFETDLWGLSVDGTVRRISTDGKSAMPSVSADGKTLLLAKRETPLVAEGEQEPHQVWVHDTTTGHEEVIYEGEGITSLDISPNGARAVFAASVARDSTEGAPVAPIKNQLADIRLLLTDVDTRSSPTRLTAETAPEVYERQGRWSPDGRYVAYLWTKVNFETYAETHEIRMIEVSSGEISTLDTYSDAEGVVIALTWDPTGNSLVVSRAEQPEPNEDQNIRYRTVRIDVTAPQRGVQSESTIPAEAIFTSRDGSTVAVIDGETHGERTPFLVTYDASSGRERGRLRLDTPPLFGLTMPRCAMKGTR